MLIPSLQEDGLLPPGLYMADMGEIAERFGRGTPQRRELFERLRMFVELARPCGALRMFVDGSFVTAKPEPGDVDVVIWLGEKYFELIECADDKALRLEEMFDTREPEEAFGYLKRSTGTSGFISFHLFESIRINIKVL